MTTLETSPIAPDFKPFVDPFFSWQQVGAGGHQTVLSSTMASATLTKPAMLAPRT